MDGHLGHMTAQAMKDTGKSVNALLAKQINQIELKAKSLLTERPVKKAKYVTLSSLESFLKEASVTYSVPYDTLLFFLDHEPMKKMIDGKLYYDARSVSKSGKHFGLMQLYSGAWSDAKYFDNYVGARKIKTFDFKFDPRQSILACAAYIRRNRQYAHKYSSYSGPFTKEIDYAMYNQGHTFVKKAKAGNAKLIGKQSPSANNTFDVARHQIRDFSRVV